MFIAEEEIKIKLFCYIITLQDLDVFDNDVQNYEIYQKALSEGEENDNSIRVNVVGNFAQGKTSLTNMLVGKDSESVQSTNGVEINSCKYSNTHEGVKFCSQRSSSDKNEYHRRIASLVKIQKDGNKSNQNTNNSKLGKLNEENASFRGYVRKTGLKQNIGKSSPKSRDYREVSRLLKMNQCDPFNADGDLQVWDFGGQFIFYATHTLFHSTTSVYLMVFDLTKPLSAIFEDPEFPNESVGKSMQQYAEYWMRSIHTYVGSDDGLQPPVILVGTHKDLLKGDETMKQKIADDYFDKIRELFEDSPIINHIQAKHFAVDCTNPCDSNIVELRKKIIRLG
ncbi:probable serine/threonine-protein kinase qkgA [Ruditapes philippinarum]|uniref:probable serine/threonine-protein kinase qkgA n=1 Tax=Ruditapes philippinarum TaxID=129788 RepID=UPI00295BDE3B|nr:probable serine/threonine-protein kinase qkgA [Ruditapes philippinarum]